MAVRFTTTLEAPFDEHSLIYLHCVELKEERYIAVPGFSCLQVNTAMAHFSFPIEADIRRALLILWSEEVKNTLQYVASPALIEVTSCSRLSIENGLQVSCVVEFEVVNAASGITVPPSPNLTAATDLGFVENFTDSTPFLKLDICKCNCTEFKSGSKVVLSALETTETVQESDNSMSEEEEDNSSISDNSEVEEVEEECEVVEYTDTMILRGSTFHVDCQNTLKIARGMLCSKTELPVCVCYEPDNPKDTNAIIIQVKVDSGGDWCRIGYISKERVPRYTYALQKGEITQAQIKCIRCQYIMHESKWVYIPTVIVTKKDKWAPTDTKYKYNAPI